VENFVIISGCSAGGKSTLLDELKRRGYATVEEPGRRIVKDELARNGAALPWNDAVAFARRAIAMSLSDRESAGANTGWTFFDRGLIDAASALQHLTGEPALAELSKSRRYNRLVFLAPPWPEIYATDPERRHDFDAAAAEYARLAATYPSLGYEIALLPKCTVGERAEFVLRELTI